MQVVLDKYLNYKRTAKINEITKKVQDLINELLPKDESKNSEDIYIHLYGNKEGDAYLVIPPKGPARLKIQANDPGEWLLLNYESTFAALQELIKELDWLNTEGAKRLVRLYKELSNTKLLRRS